MKKKKNNIIGLEIERLEKKIKQYQDYLDIMDITTMTNDDKRHKEIPTQNAIMDRLPVWLESLKKLREEAVEQKETFGDVQINKAFELLQEDKR